jgi:hypothetical protein
MKIIHKIKAILLRRRLIRQRAENIASLRAGRRAAKAIRIELAREIRLSGSQKPAATLPGCPPARVSVKNGSPTAERQLNGRISSILSNLRFERRAA